MGAGLSKRRDNTIAQALAADEDPVAQAFVQRRASLTQEQWDTFLSKKDDSQHGSSAYATLMSSSNGGGGLPKNGSVNASGPAPAKHYGGILRKKPTEWDLEVAETAVKRSRRRGNSIFGLPLISPLTRGYKAWTSFILMLDLIYTAFLIPILVGFEVSDIGWGWGCLINLIAGAFYFVELCLGWHVGFIGKHNMNKKLVMDGKAVAWFYVRHGQFLVDAITAIAWITQIVFIIINSAGVSLTGSAAATLYQIIRILRMIRFVSLMNRLYATAVAAGGAVFPALNLKRQYAYFLNLLYGGMAILSFLSCLVNFVARKEGCTNTWINHFYPYIRDYGDPNNAVLTSDECWSIPNDVKWLGGAYWMLVTMLSIGYGDISPMTEAEIIVVMFCIVAGIVFFGVLLGSIAEALTDLNKESKRIARYRARMEAVDKWMSKRSLPKGLRQRIGQYYQEEWIRDAEAVEEVQIMEELPHNLRREIAYSINLKVFRKLAVFHDFPGREQAQIASMMTPVQLPAGADVYDVDEIADCIWILHEGSCVETGPSGEEGQVYDAPAVLGETALLREIDDAYVFRPTGLRTRQQCLLWVIPMRDLLPLLRRNPTLYHKAVQQVVPAMSFDYLKINPIGMSEFGGVAPGVQPSRVDGGRGTAPTNGVQNSLVSFRSGNVGGGGPPASPFAGLEARPGSASTHAPGSPPPSGRPDLTSLHSGTPSGAGSGLTPSWSAKSAHALRGKRGDKHGASARYNGFLG